MDEMTVSVFITRKVNLGNYESVDFNVALNNVEVGATDAEMEEALATGDRAIRNIATHLRKKIQGVKDSAGGLG